jgi:hypothetical protein
MASMTPIFLAMERRYTRWRSLLSCLCTSSPSGRLLSLAKQVASVVSDHRVTTRARPIPAEATVANLTLRSEAAIRRNKPLSSPEGSRGLPVAKSVASDRSYVACLQLADLRWDHSSGRPEDSRRWRSVGPVRLSRAQLRMRRRLAMVVSRRVAAAPLRPAARLHGGASDPTPAIATCTLTVTKGSSCHPCVRGRPPRGAYAAAIPCPPFHQGLSPDLCAVRVPTRQVRGDRTASRERAIVNDGPTRHALGQR